MESVRLRAEAGKKLDEALRDSEVLATHSEVDWKFLLFALDKEDTPQFRKILLDLVPGALERFAQSSRDYGSTGATRLGAAGQFADMSRKMLKLQRGLWEGYSLNGEQPDQILDDLIAHCLLTKLFLATNNMRGEPI